MSTAFHIDEVYLGHHVPDGLPEHVGRIQALLPLAGCADELGVTLVPAQRQATHEELARVHDVAHIERIAATAGQPRVSLDSDTFTSAQSYSVACHAAGAGLDLVDSVLAGRFQNGFAAVRPPGHHAETNRAMGFCLFNNIAVAAAHAIGHHGLERVLIVDWDVHHGNGTQQIFWEDPRVLFISLHQHPLYPGTGMKDEIGAGPGRGFTINVPMPAGRGDVEWNAVFDDVVVPAANRFRPQLVLVSAGFDAHVKDPLGGMRVTEAGYVAMTDRLLAVAEEHAEGRLIAILEGGYDLGALAASVETVVRRMVLERNQRSSQ